MKHYLVRRIVVLTLVAACGAGSVFLTSNVFRFWSFPSPIKTLLLFAAGILGLVLGLLLVPRLVNGTIWLVNKGEQYFQKIPIIDLLVGVLGLIVALIIANLFGSILTAFGWLGKIVWLGLSVLLGYLGLSIGIKKGEELWSLITSIPRMGKEKGFKEVRTPGQLKIIDTSAVIDGRIADLCASGFIEGTLLVPVFVLDELHHIADSNDVLKRNRGRRGLDILNRMRKEGHVKIQVYEDVQGLANIPEVDTKLVQLAKRLNAKIITTDFNLNKVAELQGVKVLNVNELANALKPIVLPGEEMVVQVVRDGKEAGQGVAYLDDGTMIVVDGGKKYIGKPVRATVTSVLQTTAGRMIFAKLKNLREDNNEKVDGVNAVG